MKRRDLLKAAPTAARTPVVLGAEFELAQTTPAKAATAKAATKKAGAKNVPDFAEHFLTTDMNGLDPRYHQFCLRDG